MPKPLSDDLRERVIEAVAIQSENMAVPSPVTVEDRKKVHRPVLENQGPTPRARLVAKIFQAKFCKPGKFVPSRAVPECYYALPGSLSFNQRR
jgi:hypothetical protein